MTILPDAALAQHLAVTGRTGSGKTYLTKLLVEHLLDLKRRVCILDPTDAWWGLRSSADGKKPGYPVVVFGGAHADVPIGAYSGPALAEFVADNNVPCIIVTVDMLIDERRRFCSEFADTIFRKNSAPLHLIIDEADELAPQNPPPDMKVVLHRIDRIVRRGRIKGFRVMLITQRPAVLHKNVLTQASTLVAMRLMAPQDRNALKAWIEGQGDSEKGKEVLGSLAQLKRGEGWVWAPEFGILKRQEFPRIKTFDSSRAPEDGETPPPVKLADVDLSAIKSAFAEAEAEAADNDPKILRKRIQELERQIEDEQIDGVDGVTPLPDVAYATERAREVGYGEGWQACRKAVYGELGHANVGKERVAAAIDAMYAALDDGDKPGLAVTGPDNRASGREDVATAPRRVDGPPAATFKGDGPIARVLSGLAEFEAAGIRAATRVQTTFMADYGHPNSAGFVKALGQASREGLIEYPTPGMVRLTAKGRGVIGRKPPVTAAQFQNRILAKVGNTTRRLLVPLIHAYPKSMSREELCAASGYGHVNSAGFVKAVGQLRGLGLAGIPQPGLVAAEPILFLEGR